MQIGSGIQIPVIFGEGNHLEEDGMTNAEKFKEIFGFEPDKKACVAPEKICDQYCPDCVFNDWWDHEYLPCFKMKDELQG